MNIASRYASAVLLSTAWLAAQQPLDTQLLADPGFETGTGWLTPTGDFQAIAYGSLAAPSPSVSAAIQGGAVLARPSIWDGNGVTRAEQRFDLSGNAADIDANRLHVVLGGHFGGAGSDDDYWYLVARFYDGVGNQLSIPNTNPVVGLIRQVHRNSETTLLRREGSFRVPTGTRELRVGLEAVNRFANVSTSNALVDNVECSLTLDPTPAPQPLEVNLIDRGDFEATTVINPALASGWTVVDGGVTQRLYGDVDTPLSTVSNAIGGGFQVLNPTSWNGNGVTTLEQHLPLGGNAAQVDAGLLHAVLAGYFGGGGGDDDWFALAVEFRDAGGNTLPLPPGATASIGTIRNVHRNGENTLMRRQGRTAIPIGARSLVVRLTGVNLFANTSGSTAYCDNLDVRITTNPVPAPQPLNTNLLDRPDFEAVSIINPATPSCWTVTTGRVRRVPYGSAEAPPLAIAATIRGGSFALQPTSWDGNGVTRLQQSFDLAGNAADIDAGRLTLYVAGHFGGVGSDDDGFGVQTRFFNALGGQVSVPFAPTGIDLLSNTARNGDSTYLRLERAVPVPSAARTMVLELSGVNRGSTGASSTAVCDNLSATLIRDYAEPPYAYGANLLGNGDFELGSVIDPNDPTGWVVTQGRFQATFYGSPSAPLPSVSFRIGGGAFVLDAVVGSRAAMTQTHDLTGNSAEIDAGNVGLHLESYLGGTGTRTDNARIHARYFTRFGAPIGVDTLGPVTAADRQNVTDLLFRESDPLIPPGTRRLVLEVEFNGASDPAAFLDNARAWLVDRTATLLRPGSNEDLRLSTGINVEPSTGPRADVKEATAGDLLRILVESPQGGLLRTPLVLGGQVFATGSPFPSLGPDFHVNPLFPGLFLILDGTTPAGPFGPPQVLPGGTMVSLSVPNGLAGQSILFQALALTPLATNGTYASTEAHEIRFR